MSRPAANGQVSGKDTGYAERTSLDVLTLGVPPELIEVIARRTAELLGERQQAPSPWLRVPAAAAYLDCSPDRIHDLVQLGKLVPDGHDGRKPLFRPETLDAYARGCR
jgi:hypothetical protein